MALTPRLDDLLELRHGAHALGLAAHHRVNSALVGLYASVFRGQGMDYEETREYREGDDIRNMDWRVTARTGRAHTKVFQEERERPVLVVLDAGPTLYFGTRRRLKSVAAGQMAAAIAWAAVRRGDRIGGFFFAPGRHRELRPAGGRRGAMRLIQGLVDWLQPERHPTGEPEKLSSALERVRHTVRPGSLVIIVSDFFGLDEHCNRHLSRLRQHSDVIGCQVVDEAEYGLPAGRYPITDGEQSTILDTARGPARRRYEAMGRSHLEAPRELFLRHNCGWLVLGTDDDPVDVLGRELRVLVGRPV